MKERYDTKELLKYLKQLISQEQLDEVDNYLKVLPLSKIKDSNFHIEVSKVYGVLGHTSLKIRELELAIRDNPENLLAYDMLSDLYIDIGDYEKAERLLRRAINLSPKQEKFYMKLGTLYKNQEKEEQLSNLYLYAYEETKNSYFKKLLSDTSKDRIEEASIEPEHIHLVKYAMLFRGREGVYARQWIDNTGNTGYTPIKAPFTLNVIKNHILGNYTIGLYQLRSDDTITFIVFDLDVVKRFLKEYSSQRPVFEDITKKLLDTAQKIVELLDGFGIKSYVEASGFKGYHIWVFIKDSIPASLGKMFGRYVLSKIGDIPEMINIELFPKQDHLKDKESLGNLIKLPLGIHKRSGKRSLFIDLETQDKIKDQLAFLLKIEQNEEKTIKEALKELKKVIALPTEKGKFPKEEEEQEEEFILERDKEFNLIMRRCPVLGAIYDNIKSGKGLKGDEISVLIFSLGHLHNGPKIVNTLLQMANIFDEKSYLKSKLNGYPISCAKIRKRIPHITMNKCKDCFVGKDLNTYPTPVLHLKEFEKNEKDIESMILEYVDLLNKYKVTKNLLEKAKKSILLFMEERDMDYAKVGDISIRRSPDGNDLYIETGSNPNKEKR